MGKYEEKAGKGAGAAETGRRKARGKANASETGMPAGRACRKRKGSDREDAVICAMMSMPVEQQGAARAERAAKRSTHKRTLASADIPMPDPVPLVCTLSCLASQSPILQVGEPAWRQQSLHA